VLNGNRIVLEGTWSAAKSPGGWQGTWSARAWTRQSSSGRSTPGRLYTGTWQAAMRDPKARTLAEMFQRTLEQQIAGSWRSGPLAGHWWLKGSPP